MRRWELFRGESDHRYFACGLTGERLRDGFMVNVSFSVAFTLQRRAQRLTRGVSRQRSAFRDIVFATLVLGFIPLAGAHDPGISTAEVRLHADYMGVTTGFAPDDAKQLLAPSLRTDEKWSAADISEVRSPLEAVAPALWEVRSGGRQMTPRSVRVELLPGDNLSFYLEFPPPDGPSPLILKASKLIELPAGHRQFVIVYDHRGSAITRKLLSSRDYTIEVPSSAGAAEPDVGLARESGGETGGTFAGFFQLGVQHIWTGYDHLLFLFALLVVCRSFRSIVGIISCFTVAHSITLALATLDVVNLPAKFVEPMIAASIVFVGLENVVRRGNEPKGRWLLTFLFGLIHGFGFASVLRDLGVGGDEGEGIAMPLFSFNLGVELGQIVIAALVLPLIWHFRKRPKFVTRGVPIISGLVAAAGLYWLVQRTIL